MDDVPNSRNSDFADNKDFRLHKKPIVLLGAFLLLLYGLSLFFIQKNVDDFMINEKLEDLGQHILYQKALHRYIEDTQKPVFYQLQANHTIPEDFFDPRTLSFTFIARNVFTNFQQLINEKNADLPQWQYRLASDNARNPINDATPEELATLKRFNDNPTLTSLQEVVTLDGKTYLSVSLPVGKNKTSCLRCHGEPADAPGQMRASYDEKRGYFESVGHIRGFISYKIQLDQSLKQGQIFFVTFAMILFGFFSLIFSGVSWFNIREQKKQHLINVQRRQLDFLAHHDGLTQLFNRYTLDQNLLKLIKEASQNSVNNTENLWVIFLDIDHFKQINDQYGHDVGDRVLKRLASSLTTLTSQLSEANTVFRMGGEEFVIVLPQTQKSQIEQLYRDIQTDIQPHLSEYESHLCVSAGASAYRQGDHKEDILKRADQALYQAKKLGRNQLVIQ